jgi:hypothetical protein
MSYTPKDDVSLKSLLIAIKEDITDLPLGVKGKGTHVLKLMGVAFLALCALSLVWSMLGLADCGSMGNPCP